MNKQMSFLNTIFRSVGGTYQKVDLLGHTEDQFLFFEKYLYYFPKGLNKFYIPTSSE